MGWDFVMDSVWVVLPLPLVLRKVFEVGGLGPDFGAAGAKSLINWGWWLQSIHKVWLVGIDIGWVVKDCVGAGPPGRWVLLDTCFYSTVQLGSRGISGVSFWAARWQLDRRVAWLHSR